jgi:microsomal epoxide hydrolase
MQKACRGLITFTQRPVNVLMVLEPPSDASEDDLTTAEKQGVARGMDFFKFGIAYALEHGTRTSTIGLVLASNPVALMAW